MEKVFVVKRNSWHYRVNLFTVSEHGRWNFDNWLSNNATFCSYFWRTLWSLFATGTFLSILTIAIGGLIWLIFSHFDVFLEIIFMFFVPILLLIGIFVVAAVLISIPEWIQSLLSKTKRNKEPGFIGMKYHAFKNKYCPSIKFE